MIFNGLNNTFKALIVEIQYKNGKYFFISQFISYNTRMKGRQSKNN